MFRFILLLSPFILSAQTIENKTDLVLFYHCRDSISKERNKTDFYKLIDFQNKRNFDSCYVYSGKLILSANSIIEKDILNYIQGISAINKGLYKKALDNFLSISEDKKFKNLKSLKLGWSYLNQKEYNKALEYYQKWEISNETTEDRLKKIAYHNLALTYIHLKKYNLAEKYFDKELALLSSKDTLSFIRTKMDLANVYYERYLDNKAIPLFKETYDLAQIFSSLELKQNTAKNMAVIERNRKNYKASVNYYQEYNTWKDSIWNRDKIWELTEKDKKFAVAQKQQEVLLKEEELKREKVVRNGLLAGTSGLLVFIAGLGFFYKKLKDKNKLINEQKEALSVANATKNYLFSVVSHDLRSPINSIKRQHEQLAKHVANNDMDAVKEVTNSAIAVTESTSHLLNNVLHWSLEQSNQLVFERSSYALAPLLDQVLFDYEDIAESTNISISQDFEEEILVNVDKESLKIVLRNLIDNAIKYMNGAGSIDVTSSKESETQARIEIQDSGIGMTTEQLTKVNSLKDLSMDKIDRSKGVGLGLLLCQTLVKKNQGALFFESEEGKGTKAVILVSLV